MLTQWLKKIEVKRIEESISYVMENIGGKSLNYGNRRGTKRERRIIIGRRIPKFLVGGFCTDSRGSKTKPNTVRQNIKIHSYQSDKN